METSNVYRLNRDRVFANQPAPTTSAPSSTTKPKLLDRVRQTIRTRHYSIKTEEAYVGWIKRFIFFHNKRHPVEMTEMEIGQFLSSLASDRRVSASTQNQALNALLFLYNQVLEKKIGLIEGVVRAKRSQRLPVVLTKDEVKTILKNLEGSPWLMAMLLYGAGLRLMECCRLRINTHVLNRGGRGVCSPADALLGYTICKAACSPVPPSVAISSHKLPLNPLRYRSFKSASQQA